MVLSSRTLGEMSFEYFDLVVDLLVARRQNNFRPEGERGTSKRVGLSRLQEPEFRKSVCEGDGGNLVYIDANRNANLQR